MILLQSNTETSFRNSCQLFQPCISFGREGEDTSIFCSIHNYNIRKAEVEAVGLENYNYTWKITIFVKMWNLGQFLEKLIFCLYLLN